MDFLLFKEIFLFKEIQGPVSRGRHLPQVANGVLVPQRHPLKFNKGVKPLSCGPSAPGMPWTAAKLAVLAVLVLPGVATGGRAHGLGDAFVMDVGMFGARRLQEGAAAEAERAFRLVVRLEPTRWQAHYSLGASLSAMCRCSRALGAFARARALMREQGGTALQMSAVLKAQATGALPIAQVATNSSHQLRMLEFVASSLDQAFALHPEPESPLYQAVRKAQNSDKSTVTI